MSTSRACRLPKFPSKKERICLKKSALALIKFRTELFSSRDIFAGSGVDLDQLVLLDKDRYLDHGASL